MNPAGCASSRYLFLDVASSSSAGICPIQIFAYGRICVDAFSGVPDSCWGLGHKPHRVRRTQKPRRAHDTGTVYKCAVRRSHRPLRLFFSHPDFCYDRQERSFQKGPFVSSASRILIQIRWLCKSHFWICHYTQSGHMTTPELMLIEHKEITIRFPVDSHPTIP